MAESSLDSVAEKRTIQVERKAFELRPAGGPPPDPAYVKRIESTWPRVIEMGRQYGVEMKTHRFGIDTRPAHRAYKIVQEFASEQAEAFHLAIFRAYFEADENIGDIEILLSLAGELGIDRAQLRERFDAGRALEAVVSEETAARRSGITGVPAFIFVDRYLVTGLLPPDTLESVIDQVEREERNRMDEENA